MPNLHPPVAAGFDSPPLREHALALGRHLASCMRARGRWFPLRCLGERLHLLVAPRFCTTVLAVTALMSLLALGADRV